MHRTLFAYSNEISLKYPFDTLEGHRIVWKAITFLCGCLSLFGVVSSLRVAVISLCCVVYSLRVVVISLCFVVSSLCLVM